MAEAERLVEAWVAWDNAAAPRWVNDGHHGEAAANRMEDACKAVCAAAGLPSSNTFRVALTEARRDLTAGGSERDCRALTDAERLRCVHQAIDACRRSSTSDTSRRSSATDDGVAA